MTALAMAAPANITLTENAVRQAKRQAERLGKQDQWLRLGVRGGGCSGLSYVIEWESEPDPEFDETFEQDGLKIVVDIKSAKFLKGTVLEYSIKNLMDGGFVFENPNAVRSCGCGTSFTAK
jgi:iron-sulfur cluster assembly protein